MNLRFFDRDHSNCDVSFDTTISIDYKPVIVCDVNYTPFKGESSRHMQEATKRACEWFKSYASAELVICFDIMKTLMNDMSRVSTSSIPKELSSLQFMKYRINKSH